MEGALGRLIILSGQSRAVGRGKVNGNFQPARSRERDREHGRSRAAITFEDLHVIDVEDRRSVIVEDRANPLGAPDGAVGRATQVYKERLVRFVNRITQDQYPDRLFGL